MKPEKDICELILDRAAAEGATLVIWYNLAKFRVVAVAPGRERLRPRMIHVASTISGYDADSAIDVPVTIGSATTSKFSPSAELANLLRRYAAEMRRHVEGLIAAWKPLPPPPGSGSFPEVASGDTTSKGQKICDCHGVIGSKISLSVAIALLVATACGGAPGGAIESSDPVEGMTFTIK